MEVLEITLLNQIDFIYDLNISYKTVLRHIKNKQQNSIKYKKENTKIEVIIIPD